MNFFTDLPLIVFDCLLSCLGLVVNDILSLLRHLTLCPVVACAYLKGPWPRLLLQLQGIKTPLCLLLLMDLWLQLCCGCPVGRSWCREFDLRYLQDWLSLFLLLGSPNSGMTNIDISHIGDNAVHVFLSLGKHARRWFKLSIFLHFNNRIHQAYL